MARSGSGYDYASRQRDWYDRHGRRNRIATAIVVALMFVCAAYAAAAVPISLPAAMIPVAVAAIPLLVALDWWAMTSRDAAVFIRSRESLEREIRASGLPSGPGVAEYSGKPKAERDILLKTRAIALVDAETADWARARTGRSVARLGSILSRRVKSEAEGRESPTAGIHDGPDGTA